MDAGAKGPEGLLLRRIFGTGQADANLKMLNPHRLHTITGQWRFSNGLDIGDAYIRSGSNSPESVLTAPVGSIFLRDDAKPSLYSKTSGSGNTGWKSVLFGSGTLNTLPKFTPDGYEVGNSLVTDDGTTVVVGGFLSCPGSGANSQRFGANANPGTGARVTVLGTEAGNSGASGNDLTFIGYRAGQSATTGNNNVAVGNNAFQRITNSSSNVALGVFAGRYTTGGNNTCVGYFAGHGVDGSSTYSTSVLIGSDAGASLTTGNNNVLVGYAAGEKITTNAANTILGYLAGRHTTGQQNTVIGAEAGEGVSGTSTYAGCLLIGYKAGEALTTPAFGAIHAVGYQSIQEATTSNNITAFGYQAGRFQTGARNTYVGYNAGLGVTGLTSGNDKTLVGYEAGLGLTTGANHAAVGRGTLTRITTVGQCTAIGVFAGRYTTGGNNTCLGYNSGAGVDGSSTYSASVLVGSNAGTALTTGSNHVMVGYQSGLNITTGADNVLVGNQSGLALTTENRNVAVGSTANFSASVNNGISLGYGALCQVSNTMVIGDDGTNNQIDAIYFGKGYNAAAPAGPYSLNPTGGNGSNIAGAGLDLCGGVATGNATGGFVRLRTTVVGSSGSSRQSFQTILEGDNLGNCQIGLPTLAQAATDGFPYIPQIADVPSGTPTAKTGFCPLAVDVTNNRLYIYANGAWRYAALT